MAQKVLIMGESGTGKSTSLRNCDAAITAVVNPVGKPLPFKNHFDMLNNETDARKIVKYMKEQAAAGKKLIVVDDFQYILAVPYMNRIKETGWDKYNDFGANYFEIIDCCKDLPDDVVVVYMTHLETLDNAVVNIMQCNCSMVITDPKGELLRKTGGLLEREGYEVRVFDLINPETSFCYNPFAYVRDDKDVLKLINNLIRNTTPKGAQSSDPFWEKSETALLQALMLYLLHEAPPEEQNFSMIMEMLGSAQVKEDDEEYQSPLDILFERLEMRNPESIAVKQYAIYKQAAGKTAKSILISVGVRLAAFNLKQIANLTCTDELDLYSIGEKKVALFCCIPDADTSLNYLVGMIYSNLFQTLYYVADRKYHGKLPIPVHCIMDEWPNVALPDDFDKLLATMRSRAISCSIIIQNIAQMKALFKDSWESLIGNCDEFLYLGGNEKEGHKYVSELLGKETLDTNTYGQTKGRSGSYSVNFQQSGRELLTPDEVRLLDNRKAVLLVRGEHPILDEKYDLHKHVNVKYTEDGGAPPYDYAKAPLSHEDVTIDTRRLDDYELLSAEEILGGEQSF